MFNILIVAHGNLAGEFLNSCKMIVGEQDGIYALGLQNDGVEAFSAKLEKLFSEINTADGLLIMADLYGGTPCNTTILKILNKYDNTEMITGANLSMVIEAAANRSGKLKEAINLLKDVGVSDICDMREKLKEENDLDSANE
jgi:mannose/fructose/sorbose-specific phosphotransferase system IIA component